MTKKAIIFILYFGEWPSYWPLFAQSLKRNPDFDFLIIGDAVPDLPEIENVQVVVTTLTDLKARFSSGLGVEVALTRAYKLCDFRPMYGDLFAEYVEGYPFWGYADNDMVFGDLSRFLTEDILAKHDKIFSRGHLTLYRNTPKMNLLFQQDGGLASWREVVSSPQSMVFDEWNGIHKIAQTHAIETYLEEVILDVSARQFQMRRTRGETTRPQTMFYHDGRVYLHQYEKELTEFAYIHMQKRPMRYLGGAADGERVFYFTPDRIIAQDQVSKRRDEMSNLNPAPALKELRWWARNWQRRARSAIRQLRAQARA